MNLSVRIFIFNLHQEGDGKYWYNVFEVLCMASATLLIICWLFCISLLSSLNPEVLSTWASAQSIQFAGAFLTDCRS